jgi:GT2 family glycosyltransferase
VLLSVIIVSYNVKYFLEQCLCSLQAALTDIDAEVLVIDNCSADSSIAYLQPHFPWVTFIQNNINEGFAKANNKALQLAKGEYILFLNPDTILAEDTLQQCIDFFSKHTEAGAVGVRMIDGAGIFLPESKRAFPSPLVSFYKLMGLSALFPKSGIFNKYALGFLSEKEVHEVDVLSGAFMMVKKNILDKIGAFDEQFFMYAEDIDLSYRIQKAGFKNYYLGDLTIIHFKGESTQKGSLNYVRMFYEAMRLFVRKHYSGAGAWFIGQGLHAGIVLRQMVAALALPFYKANNKNNILSLQRVYLVGNAAQSESAIKMIERNYSKTAIQNVCNASELNTISKESVIVFCIGKSLTYKEAIQLSQAYPNISLLMWSGKGTCSIAGSNNKNASGYIWY